MKRSLIYISLVFLAAVTFVACRKSDNPKLPVLIRVPTPLIKKDPTGDQTLSAKDASKFNAKIIVDVLFKSDVLPQKMDLVIIKNTSRANVKTLQADITAFPTTVTLTGAQLVSLFGSPVAQNDRFDIGVDITTQAGQKYLAFPTDGGAAYATSISNQVGSSVAVNFIAAQ